LLPARKKFKKPKRGTLRWAILIIAILGGYLINKYPPGLITIWRGLVDLEMITVGYLMSREDMYNC